MLRNTPVANNENEESKKYEIVLTTQDEESKYESVLTSARHIFGLSKGSNPDSTHKLRHCMVSRSQFFNEHVGDLTGSGSPDSAYVSETDTVQRRRLYKMDE